MSNIIPSQLYKVAVFESVHVYKPDGEGRCLVESTDTIERQIDKWVKQSKVLIVGTGPVSVFVRETGKGKVKLTAETRTLAVTYVPPVEQDDMVYGNNQRESTSTLGINAGPAKSQGAASAASISDGPSRKRGTLRVPAAEI